MPKKEMVKAKFNFSYGHLKQLGDGTLILIDRDIAEFNDRGFNATKRTAFVNAINSFANFATDEQMDGIKITATETKDATRNVVETKMRTIFLAAKNVFGANTGTYREFGNPDLTKQSDAELVRNAKMMVTTTTKYLTNLSGEGITTAKITSLDGAKTIFDNAIDAQEQAIRNRDNSTEKRATIANDLYDLIVKYNDTGKDVWVETSESKYNDYVIYDTATGLPDANVLPPLV